MSVDVKGLLGLGQPRYVLTCPSCSHTLLRYKPDNGERHTFEGRTCEKPWSYVEVGSLTRSKAGYYYLKLPPTSRRKRRSA